MNDWFRREGVVTIENKFSYIITAAEDDIIPSLREEQVRLNRVPTLDECVALIKKKYWRENKKIDKLRQLKRIIIEPNETVFDFNTRYLELYDQLETQDKVSFSVIDYENSLRPRFQIYERVVMAETSTIEEACNLAEKYENILKESHWRNERSLYDYNNYSSIKQPIVISINSTNNSWNRNGMNFKNLRNISINMPSNAINKVNYNIPNNYNNVNKMRHLQIKTCFFCDKSYHLTKDCSDLARIKQDHNFSKYINSPKNYFTATRRSKDDRYASLIKAKRNFKNNNNNIDINNINNLGVRVENYDNISDNNISYNLINRKILKPKLNNNSTINNSNKNSNYKGNGSSKNKNNIDNINESINKNKINNNILNNNIPNLTKNYNNNKNNFNINNKNNNNYNNKINNNKNDTMDDVIKVEQNKLNMLKIDNFREKNNKIGNINNRKYV